MNANNDYTGGEEPDLDRWLADLTNSVSDDDTAAFLRPYRDWDGQEPLGDYVARASKSPRQAAPSSVGADVHSLRSLRRSTSSEIRPAERDLPRTASLRTNLTVGLPARPPALPGEPGDGRKARRRFTQEQLDSGYEGDEGAGHWNRFAAAVIAAALVVAVAIGGSAVLRGSSRPIAAQPNKPSAARTSFSFSYPASGALGTTLPVTIRGTGELPPGRQLWFLIGEHVAKPYFVATEAPIPVDSSNRWSLRLQKVPPRPSGAHPTTDLHAIDCLADGELEQMRARRPANSEWVRLSEIPADCIPLGVLYLQLEK